MCAYLTGKTNGITCCGRSILTFVRNKKAGIKVTLPGLFFRERGKATPKVRCKFGKGLRVEASGFTHCTVTVSSSLHLSETCRSLWVSKEIVRWYCSSVHPYDPNLDTMLITTTTAFGFLQTALELALRIPRAVYYYAALCD